MIYSKYDDASDEIQNDSQFITIFKTRMEFNAPFAKAVAEKNSFIKA